MNDNMAVGIQADPVNIADTLQKCRILNSFVAARFGTISYPSWQAMPHHVPRMRGMAVCSNGLIETSKRVGPEIRR